MDRVILGLPAGPDVVIGGHWHSLLKKPQLHTRPDGSKVLLAYAGEYMQYLGRIDLYLTKNEAGKYDIIRYAGNVIPIDASIQPDPEFQALIDNAAKRLLPKSQPATTPAEMNIQ